MAFAYQREIVSSWFERRRTESQTPFDPFIYTWIALNAALSARYGPLSDRGKVVKFGDELAAVWTQWLAADRELREAANDLAARSPIYEDRPRSGGTRSRAIVTADDARSVMLGIYAVRNNLFHGAKQFDVRRDHALVALSTRLLERIFMTSELYEMASQPGRDLSEPIPGSEVGDAPAAG